MVLRFFSALIIPNPSGNAGTRHNNNNKTQHEDGCDEMPGCRQNMLALAFCRQDSLFARDSEMSQEGSPSSDPGSMTVYPFVSQNCGEPWPGSFILRAPVKVEPMRSLTRWMAFAAAA